MKTIMSYVCNNWHKWFFLNWRFVIGRWFIIGASSEIEMGEFDGYF